MTFETPNRPVVRFAPSPNGRLHLGHARSALLNGAFAKRHDGRFLLRIEDIDTARSKPEFEAAIFEDLDWLGLEWPQPVRRQSDHFDLYRQGLDQLDRLGLIYPAFLSRSEIRASIAAKEKGGQAWPHDPDGALHYPGNERDMPASQRKTRINSGEPFTWRLDMRRALTGLPAPLIWKEAGEAAGAGATRRADPALWGDVVLARRDTPASYHLSVVMDDAEQGITDIIRGEDLLEATAIHRLLQTLLGLPEPIYRHHRLVRDTGGRKLSKSDGDTAISALREAGHTTDEIRAFAGIGAPLVPFGG